MHKHRSAAASMVLVGVMGMACAARAQQESPGQADLVPRSFASEGMARPRDDVAERDELARSGKTRIAAGAGLIVLGALGGVASNVGTVLTIIYYVKDARHECRAGACDSLSTAGTWVGLAGTATEIVGLGTGIPLLVSGVRRLHQSRHPPRLGLAPVLPSGGGVVAHGAWQF